MTSTTTTTAPKRDWHHQVEHERRSLNIFLLFLFHFRFFSVPPNEVHQTNDGKTIRIEYREENGTIYKVISKKCFQIQIKFVRSFAFSRRQKRIEVKKSKFCRSLLNEKSRIESMKRKENDEEEKLFFFCFLFS